MVKEAAGNPAIRQFGDLLPASGRYPAKWVQLFWNTNEELEIGEVEVVFVPRGEDLIPSPQEGDFWERFAAYSDRWLADDGNSMNDWLEPGGDTPESIFGRMLEREFWNKGELHRALREFAHIEECEWARQMVTAFDPER